MPRTDATKLKTPADRSDKAHMAPPPKKVEPHVPALPRGSRDVGEFGDRGRPPLIKK